MITRIAVTAVRVLDQEEALDFYVNKLGMEVGSDIRRGPFRWLTVRVPDAPDTEIVLEEPGPPIHDEAIAAQLRELIAKLPASFKDDPLVAELNKAAKENTITVVHLIYRSKSHEASSKDYDFSRLGMVEHWAAGERDVYASMSHPDWLNRPQPDETMVTYDLSEDGLQHIKSKQE